MESDQSTQQILRSIRTHLWFNTILLALLIVGFLFGGLAFVYGLAAVTLSAFVHAVLSGISVRQARRDSERSLSGQDSS